MPDLSEARPKILESAFERSPVLMQFKQPRSKALDLLRKSSLFAICIGLGLIYGILLVFFPPQLLVYLFMPIALLALFVVWSLPDTDIAPTKLLSRLFFGYLGILILWPNYIAIQYPGLPWISLRRLLVIPALLTFLICLSTSPTFRARLSSVISASRPLSAMLAVFTVFQLLVIGWSTQPGASLNWTLNYWIASNAAFIMGAWVLSQKDQAEKFVNWLIVLAVIISVIGFLEFWNKAALWANYIPSWLQVDPQILQSYTSRVSRDQEFRTTTTFSVSLCMAEFLILVCPFVIHKAFQSQGVARILGWVILDVILLGAIEITQSRLGILGWIIAHAVYACFWAMRRWNRMRAALIGPALSLVFPTGALAFFVGMFTIPAIRNRTIGGGSTGFSDQARQVQYDMMWPKLLDNPFGYGGGQSGFILNYRLPSGLLTVDSYIITLLLDLGVVGFVAFFGPLVFGIYRLFSISWRASSGSNDLALPLAISLVIAIEVKTVLSQPDNIPLIFMLLGLAVASIWQEKVRATTPLNGSHK